MGYCVFPLVSAIDFDVFMFIEALKIKQHAFKICPGLEV